jgi:hypothetical protein
VYRAASATEVERNRAKAARLVSPNLVRSQRDALNSLFRHSPFDPAGSGKATAKRSA